MVHDREEWKVMAVVAAKTVEGLLRQQEQDGRKALEIV